MIAGNWKMNGRIASSKALAMDILQGLMAEASMQQLEWLIFPPFVHLHAVSELLHSNLASSMKPPVRLGAQDLSVSDDGAFTGDISAAMLVDLDCASVLIGHSERRQYHREDDELIGKKLVKALHGGLQPILCVGESEQERKEGRTEAVIARQLSVLEHCPPDADCLIAYEPVWAIGTGNSASPDDAQKVHAFIRSRLALCGLLSESIRILYGGSVKPENAEALFSMPDIDGALIGGASLQSHQFLAIGEAALRSKIGH